VPESAPLRLHEDSALFREALTFTAAETGFAPRLIEKDYFCTLALRHLAANAPDLVFKGDTCLAKVHSGFYRLSEDLDYLIPMPVKTSRADRSRKVAGSRNAVDRLEEQAHGLRLVKPLTGANDSRQYIALIGYHSLLGAQEEAIKVEVGLREPLLTPAIHGDAQTLLMDPIVGGALVGSFALPCLSRDEAMAEKLRAAFARREPAIRDFYDVDQAVRRQGLRVLDASLLDLVRKKLAVPGNEPVDVSVARLADLRSQIVSRLRPVLRDQDFAEFDLERAFAVVTSVAAALA
jgi:predicted nucleotidyltransferase component of viral defense system